MPVATTNPKSLFGELASEISERDLADISKFIDEELLGPNPTVELRASVEAFAQVRFRYWLRRTGRADDETASMADIDFAIKRAVNAGARKDRMLGLASKLSHALAREE